MKRKTSTSSVKWTQKNRTYLERLGILDARTGGVRKNGMNLNKFINDCISMVLEAGKNHEASTNASTEELERAWIKFQVSQKNKEIEDLRRNIIAMAMGTSLQRGRKHNVELTIESEKSRMEGSLNPDLCNP